MGQRTGDKRGKPSALPKPDGPTSTSTARVAPVASATPAPSVNMATKCSPVTGTIKVASDDGSLDGFLGSPNEEGLYGFTADASAAVKFSYNPCDSTPFDITGEAVKSEGKTYELVGGVQDPRTGCFLVGDVPKSASSAPTLIEMCDTDMNPQLMRMRPPKAWPTPLLTSSVFRRLKLPAPSGESTARLCLLTSLKLALQSVSTALHPSLAQITHLVSVPAPAAPITYSTSTGLFALNGSGSCPGVNTVRSGTSYPFCFRG